MKRIFALAVASFGFILGANAAHAEQVGAVDTAFKLIGPDHKIVVDVFDDPRVQGVSCYLSRAKTGGITGALGLAEDKADASVSCGQSGDIRFLGTLPQQEEVFTVKASILFKHMRVVRMVDRKRNTLVYLVYSDRLVDGSPKSSVTHVPIPPAQKIPLK
jgi:CreA protein